MQVKQETIDLLEDLHRPLEGESYYIIIFIFELTLIYNININIFDCLFRALVSECKIWFIRCKE